MKIVKHGTRKMERSYQFRCQRCFCEFIAERKGEYFTLQNSEGEEWIASRCPECHQLTPIVGEGIVAYKGEQYNE